MTRLVRPPRVVIDTNLVLSALVFPRGRTAMLRQAWSVGHIQPLASRATAAELMRVFGYPKFRLTPEEQRELLADYLPCCKSVRISDPPPSVPDCRDACDLPFLQLTVAGKAAALITGDRDLLVLDGTLACPIVTAERFFETLTS